MFEIALGVTPFPVRGFSKILSPDEANEKLVEYRNFILSSSALESFHSSYSCKFKLRHMPRRGPETISYGEISGPALGAGVFRIQILDPKEEGKNLVFLVLNPKQPEIWRSSSGIPKVQEMSLGFLFQEIIPGMNLTYFDLLTPFVFWEEQYLKSGKVCSRPAHLYEFLTPEWVRGHRPSWERIVMALDDVYDIPLKVEVHSASKHLRTISLRSFKKTGSEWIVKSSDCINEQDRSNTRLQILGAATNLDLSSTLFSVDGFSRAIKIPDESYQDFE